MRRAHPATPAIGAREMDAIREIGNIGAGHAATALSRLTGTRVEMSVPRLAVHPIAGIPPFFFSSAEDPVRGVLVPYRGDLDGRLLLLFPEEGARSLGEYLLPGPDPADSALLDSALAETGAIVARAFLTVISGMTGHILLLSPPLVVRDMAGAILDEILAEAGTGGDRVLTLDFSLREPKGEVLARAVLLPDPTGLGLFLQAADRLRAGR